MWESEKASTLTPEEDTLRDVYLTFSLGQEIFGIEVRYVTEIVSMQTITEIPYLPEHVKGVINLRGSIIPVIDVRLRFRKEPMAYTERTCVIVIDIGNTSLGLIVDSVADVITIPEEDTVDPPEFVSARNRCIKKIGKVDNEVKLLLDCETLLSEDEMETLSQAL